MFDEFLLILPILTDESEDADCLTPTISNTVHLSIGQVIIHLIPMFFIVKMNVIPTRTLESRLIDDLDSGSVTYSS